MVGGRGTSLQEVPAPPQRECPSGWGPPSSEAGQRLRGQSGAQLPHTDVANHPEVLPPDNRDIPGCHLSSFLCLSEDYRVAMQAGTALVEAGEARWNTIELQRGNMLLMVATSRHHGLPALPDSNYGLQGAFWTCGPPTPGAAPTTPPPRTWTPPPLRGPGRCWGFVQLELPQRGPLIVGGARGG